MSAKIFCDIADINLIKKFNKKKIVKGLTTNPSLMRKAGAKDYKSYSKKILQVCKNKPISFDEFLLICRSLIQNPCPLYLPVKAVDALPIGMKPAPLLRLIDGSALIFAVCLYTSPHLFAS